MPWDSSHSALHTVPFLSPTPLLHIYSRQSKCHIIMTSVSWLIQKSLLCTPTISYSYLLHGIYFVVCNCSLETAKGIEQILYSFIHNFVHNTEYIACTQYIFLEWMKEFINELEHKPSLLYPVCCCSLLVNCIHMV